MKKLSILLLMMFATANLQTASAQNDQLLLRYLNAESFPSLSEDQKVELVRALHVRAKEIKAANRNMMFNAIGAGITGLSAAIHDGIEAGKERQAINDAAREQQIAQSRAEQQSIRNNYQQQMAARGVDVTQTQTQQVSAGQSAYTFAPVNQNKPQQRQVVSSNGSDAYGQRGASVGMTTSQPYTQSSSTEQITTGCAIVNGVNTSVQLKVVYSSSIPVVKAIKLNTSKINGVVDSNWVSVYQNMGVSRTSYQDGSYSNDYNYSFDYDMGLNNRVRIYFN